ncbi:MAG: type II CRISPR-associated endonuclease Cas1 [Clostridioides sp.]|nr:type II CRISPR-associated endonuclease Cas1 [Clostridioides sp.]
MEGKMSWRTVHIKDCEKMKIKLDNLEVTKLGEKYFIPLADIATIIVEGVDTVITTRLLSQISKYNIVLVICDQKYLPTGLFLSYGSYHKTAKRAMHQSQWSKSIKENIWKEIVSQKINNQLEVIKILKYDSERSDLMKSFVENILPGDSTNREGHAAKVYFNSLYGMNFTREDACIENAMMNFGYAIVRSQVARLVVGQGLLPMLGVFHRNEYNAYNLVDDLMEPFRPIMDYYINTKVLDEDEYLTYEKRLKLINFLNQPMKLDGKNSSVDIVMQNYILSFVKSMEDENVFLLNKIKLSDFLE